MGVVTAVFGGIIRDVLVNEVPWVVNSYQLYAVLAFLGGLLVWALVELGVGSIFAVSIAALAIMTTRMLSMIFDWRLPGWRLGPQTEAIPVIKP